MPSRPADNWPELVAVQAKLDAVTQIATQLVTIVRDCERVLRDLRQRPRTTVSVPEDKPPVPAVDPHSGLRVLTVAEVARRFALSKSTIWRMVSDGRLPPPSKITGRRVGWMESDVDAWLAARFRRDAR